jgi:PIN domain nuclease of toxin-antitoxin system
MRLLLDSHAFLWAITDSNELSTKARDVLTDPDNELFLSVASIWELAIKASIGKLTLRMPLGDLLLSARHDLGLRVLQVELDHALAVQDLPFHHRDPFDRLLVVQARSKGMPILSRDAVFDRYELPRIW